MASSKEKIKTIQIHGSKILVQNESWKLPFSFSLGHRRPDSYNGINVNFSYKCEILIDIHKDDLPKFERNLLSKIKTFITTDSSEKVSQYFNVSKSNFQYQVIESKFDLNLKTNWILAIGVGIIFLCVISYIFPNKDQGLILLSVIAAGLFIYLIKVLFEKAMGPVNLKIFNNQNFLQCQLTKSQKLNLSDLKLYYEVIEEVEDSRGTSSITRKSVIYQSLPKSISEFSNHTNIKFEYPNKLGLQTYDGSKVKLYWQMNLEGKYFFITFLYKGKFKVVRC